MIQIATLFVNVRTVKYAATSRLLLVKKGAMYVGEICTELYSSVPKGVFVGSRYPIWLTNKILLDSAKGCHSLGQQQNRIMNANPTHT